MLGHHIAKTGDGTPRTFFIADESSGVDDNSCERADTWADRKLLIGNCYACRNVFFRGIKGGDVPTPDGKAFYRKVIRITAEDSPNVRLALEQKRAGQEPTGEVILPGVLPWYDYQKRRTTWDKVKQCVGLDAQFWEGADELMFPPEWLDRARRLALEIKGTPRKARAIGIDPAEGGDKTAMCAVDEYGVVELVSRRTPNTAVITSEALAFMRKHGVPAERVCFDRGGGGKQHADALRAQGYNVHTVAFGGSSTESFGKVVAKSASLRRNWAEQQYAYKNMRAEMYGTLRRLLDPSNEHSRGFAIPEEYTNLRCELAPVPLLYDREGRLEMLPKHRTRGDRSSTTKCLVDLIGHSPDESDALVLGVWAMLYDTRRPRAGVMF